jgi:hypothetical protein
MLTLDSLLVLVLLKDEELEGVLVAAGGVVEEGSGLLVAERVVADVLEVWQSASLMTCASAQAQSTGCTRVLTLLDLVGASRVLGDEPGSENDSHGD